MWLCWREVGEGRAHTRGTVDRPAQPGPGQGAGQTKGWVPPSKATPQPPQPEQPRATPGPACQPGGVESQGCSAVTKKRGENSHDTGLGDDTALDLSGPPAARAGTARGLHPSVDATRVAG
jgi:hypothetical protein